MSGVDYMMSAEKLQHIAPKNVRLIERKIRLDGVAKDFELELWHSTREATPPPRQKPNLAVMHV